MPLRRCANPLCCEYIPRTDRYCSAHREQATAERAESYARYDQHRRDPEAKAFYHSAAWLRARATKLAADPVCERCRRVFAQHVHHIVPLRECRPDQKLAQSNLFACCASCHAAIEAAERSKFQ